MVRPHFEPTVAKQCFQMKRISWVVGEGGEDTEGAFGNGSQASRPRFTTAVPQHAGGMPSARQKEGKIK